AVRAATHADQTNLPKRTKTATIAELQDPGILRRKKQAREWGTATGQVRGHVGGEPLLPGHFVARPQADRAPSFLPVVRLDVGELHRPNYPLGLRGGSVPNHGWLLDRRTSFAKRWLG